MTSVLQGRRGQTVGRHVLPGRWVGGSLCYRGIGVGGCRCYRGVGVRGVGFRGVGSGTFVLQGLRAAVDIRGTERTRAAAPTSGSPRRAEQAGPRGSEGAAGYPAPQGRTPNSPPPGARRSLTGTARSRRPRPVTLPRRPVPDAPAPPPDLPAHWPGPSRPAPSQGRGRALGAAQPIGAALAAARKPRAPEAARSEACRCVVAGELRPGG